MSLILLTERLPVATKYPPYSRPSTPPSDLLTTREACAYLRVGRTTLRQYIADGLIRPLRLGPKNLRFDPRDLDSVLR